MLDAFVCFNKQSFDKYKGDVNANTVIYADSTFISEEDVAATGAGTIHMFPATKYAEDNFGSAVCANIIMMGCIVAKNDNLSLENAQEAIKEVMAPKIVPMNLKALQFGYEKGLETN